jgi:hypothetical protein
MRRRRTGTIVALGVVLLSAAGVAVAAATGRLPLFHHAWGTIASSLALSPSSSAAAPSATTDAGALDAGADARPPPRRQTAPLSSAQLGAPLVHGSFVTACGAPDDMKVVVKVAVKMGRASDIKVKTTPPDPGVEACVERAMRDLQWDISPKTGHVTVTY